jgi:hypothetical protein
MPNVLKDEEMVEIKIGPAEIVIEINKIPHLILRRADLTAIHSWIHSVGVVETYFFIEYTTRNGTITSDYDDRSLWEEILKKLGQAKLFNEMQGEPSR